MKFCFDPIHIHIHLHADIDVNGLSGGAATLLIDLVKRGLCALEQQGEKMTDISDRLDALTASTQRVDDAVGSVQTFVQGIPALVQAAVDAAVAKGATPEQLAAFDELNARLSGDADKIVASLTTNSSGNAPATTA